MTQATSAVASTRPLLSYDYGNQAERSRYEVSSTGVVTHKEVVTATETVISQRNLTSAELRKLKAKIAAAARGTLEKREGAPTSMGSRSGDLFVTTAADKQVVISRVERAEIPNGSNPDIITTNKAAAAREIYKMVTDRTKVDIPQ